MPSPCPSPCPMSLAWPSAGACRISHCRQGRRQSRRQGQDQGQQSATEDSGWNSGQRQAQRRRRLAQSRWRTEPPSDFAKFLAGVLSVCDKLRPLCYCAFYGIRSIALEHGTIKLLVDLRPAFFGPLPGSINDDFTGKAPDLGALEVGKPIPVYGPRPLTK